MGRDGSSNCDPGSRERGAGVVAGKKVAAGPEAVQCVVGEKTSPKTASSGLMALAISSYFYTKHLHTRTLRQRDPDADVAPADVNVFADLASAPAAQGQRDEQQGGEQRRQDIPTPAAEP